MLIQEIRYKTKLSQNEFAKRYDIPVSTLRKWEQGETSPSEYLIKLLIKDTPELNKENLSIGNKYHLNPTTMIVYDNKGNSVHIKERIEDIESSNLILFLDEYFNNLYSLQTNLNDNIKYDLLNNIEWKK